MRPGPIKDQDTGIDTSSNRSRQKHRAMLRDAQLSLPWSIHTSDYRRCQVVFLLAHEASFSGVVRQTWCSCCCSDDVTLKLTSVSMADHHWQRANLACLTVRCSTINLLHHQNYWVMHMQFNFRQIKTYINYFVLSLITTAQMREI